LHSTAASSVLVSAALPYGLASTSCSRPARCCCCCCFMITNVLPLCLLPSCLLLCDSGPGGG
jgi:hypothetical protein